MFYNHFSQIGKNLHKDLAQLVKDTAEHIQAGYQANCRVDTGAQHDGVYVVTSADSTYSAAVGAASSANPKAGILPELEQPTSETEAKVGVVVNYAAINEVGGVHHTGDGAMARAGDFERGVFESALGALRWRA